MAFKSVSESSFKKLTALGIGESITGYLLGTRNGKLENSKVLVMKIDGKMEDVAAAGNVRYLIQDNKLAIGANTRITRVEDSIVKGKKSTKFSVEQDMEDVISTENQADANSGTEQAAAPTSMAEKINKLKGK